jgi:hypothetical protein
MLSPLFPLASPPLQQLAPDARRLGSEPCELLPYRYGSLLRPVYMLLHTKLAPISPVIGIRSTVIVSAFASLPPFSVVRGR